MDEDSAKRIRESIDKSGGAPFGAPMGHGVSSLTERAVRFFKQKGHFGFETYEASAPKSRRNPFTQHGATRFRGSLAEAAEEPENEEIPSLWQRARGMIRRWIGPRPR